MNTEVINPTQLPEGVCLQNLIMNHDRRGWLTEVYRKSSHPSCQPIQWDAVSSHAGVLRGAHLHHKRSDFLLVMQGEMFVGLKDVRSNSTTYGLVSTLSLNATNQQLLIIPPGIVHGFYHEEPSTILYGMDFYWDSDDESVCFWQDAELGIPWPCKQPILSERDRNAQSFRELVDNMEAIY